MQIRASFTAVFRDGMFNLYVAILSIFVPFVSLNDPRTLERAIFLIGCFSVNNMHSLRFPIFATHSTGFHHDKSDFEFVCLRTEDLGNYRVSHIRCRTRAMREVVPHARGVSKARQLEEGWLQSKPDKLFRVFSLSRFPFFGKNDAQLGRLGSVA
jgi:hypothetical protein